MDLERMKIIYFFPLPPFLADHILIDDRISTGFGLSFSMEGGPGSGIYSLDISSLTFNKSGTGTSNGQKISS